VHARDKRLFAALDALGIEPATITPITGNPPWSRRARTFAVTSNDGTTVKARLLRRPAMAARVCTLAGALDDDCIAPPIAQVGAVLVEPWIEGTDLARQRLRAAHVDAAADLLARIHAFTGLDGERLPRLQSTAPARARAEAQLAELTAAGALRRREAAGLHRLLRHLPARARWGLTHKDLCADNFVVRPSGALAMIDNEHLGRSFLDYDVARTWYRWAMPDWAWARFTRRYRAARREHQPSPDADRAWRATVVLKSVQLRHRTGASMDAARGAVRALLT
jgi:aminoglycoside phosphotransferase